MNDEEFRKLCDAVGGSYQRGIGNTADCYSEDRGSEITIDYSSQRVDFRSQEGLDIHGHANDVGISGFDIFMNNGEGWNKDAYYRDTTVRFNAETGAKVSEGTFSVQR